MGPEARKVISSLSKAGGLMWHDLPFATTDHGGCPYNSPAVFAGEFTRISMQDLAQDGFITVKQEESYFDDVSKGIENDDGINQKRVLLEKAYKQFDNDATPENRAKFETWHSRQGSWLGSFAAFSALTAVHEGNNTWQEWSPSARDHCPEAINSVRLTPEYNSALFTQWLFHGQAFRLKKEASQQNVGIIGDVPFYVAGSSADVWANRNIFSVDADGYPLLRSGVPPDCFSEDGQLWGNPVYKWHDPAVRKELYKWYGDRFKRVLEYSHTVRIDHARALANYYIIDAGASNARNARLEVGPGDEFLDYLEGELGKPMPFIAEDLGNIDDSVRNLIKRHELPGLSVPQFAPWGNNASGNEHHPDNAHRRRVIYSGTHDNDTVNNYVKGLAVNATDEFNYYFGIGTDTDPATQVIEKIWGSPAGLAIASIADVLSMGAEGRYNTPGTMHPDNWSKRYSIDAFASRIDWLGTITKASGRNIAL
jgi:4-alpha-glucanotransferase